MARRKSIQKAARPSSKGSLLPRLNTGRILESISDGFIAVDKEWRYLYLNHQAAELSSHRREELIGKSLLRVHRNFKETVFYRKYKQAMDTKRKVVFSKVYPFLKKWYLIHVYPASHGLSVYFSDITRQKEAERGLLEIEERYRLMIENARDYALFSLDQEGKIKTWGKGAEKMYGYAEKEILGKHVRILYPAEDVRIKKPEKELRIAIRKGKLESEGWRLHKNSSSFWSSDMTAALKTRNGRLLGFSRLTKDMTERKMGEEILRERTKDLEAAKELVEREKAEDEALLDSIGEGVIATDADGRVTLINARGEAMLGLSRKKVVGNPYYEMWNVEDGNGSITPHEKRPLAIVLSTGKKVTDTTHYFSTRHKKAFPVSTTAAPVILDGEIIGAIEVFRDIHKEKEIDKAKSEFVSLASHQLRTPLTAIKLFVEMLKNGNLGELTLPQHEVVKNVHESNEKMIQLVESLLNMSRLETGRIKLKFEPVTLSSYLRGIIRDAMPLARAKKRQLSLMLPKHPVQKAHIDPHMMRQVVMNLVSNAIDYSEAPVGKKPYVKVSLFHRPEGFEIKVENRGIGIPAEVRHRLFERFFRAENAIKAKTEGTGLGLYMSKLIVERHGGKIWLNSERDGITVFAVFIPFRKDPEPQLHAPTHTHAKK